MYGAMEIVRRLVELAEAGEEPDPLTPMRVQKLLYYAQGWHLGVFGTPLFREGIQAWKHGPVVREVWQEFKGSKDPVRPGSVGPSNLAAEARTFVDSVWDRYKSHSANGLRDMTHGEPPWLSARARAGVTTDEWCQEEIRREEMLAYFKGKADAGRLPGLDPASTYRGAAQMAEGRGVPHGRVFTALKSRLGRGSQEGGGACTS